jgi:hypothetical protein
MDKVQKLSSNEDFMCAAVTVIRRVSKSVKLLQLSVVTGYKSSTDLITDADPASSH